MDLSSTLKPIASASLIYGGVMLAKRPVIGGGLVMIGLCITFVLLRTSANGR